MFAFPYLHIGAREQKYCFLFNGGQIKKFDGTAITASGISGESYSTADGDVLNYTGYIFAGMWPGGSGTAGFDTYQKIRKHTYVASSVAYTGTIERITSPQLDVVTCGTKIWGVRKYQVYNGTTPPDGNGVYPANAFGSETLQINSWDGSNFLSDYTSTSALNKGETGALGNFVYLLGGSTAGQAIQRYNLASSLTTLGATLPSVTKSMGANCTLNDNIYIFGAYNTSWSNVIQQFNGTTASTHSATVASATWDFVATTFKKNAYIFKPGTSSAVNVDTFNGTTITTTSTSLSGGDNSSDWYCAYSL